MTIELDHLGIFTTTDAERGRVGTVAVEPHRTDWGTVSAYVAGPHGVLVALYEWAEPAGG